MQEPVDILVRLRGYNPPDRTVDDQRQIAIDISDAANEIERLRQLERESAAPEEEVKAE